MNYNEAIDFLFSQLPMYQRKGRAAYKANLDNTHKLDAYFGHPHRKFKSIHVAGTNGKGSVSHQLAAVLQAAGYRTGLYTSPHLKSFRERIKINGEMIPEPEVVDFVTNHQAVIKDISPSFFEMTVAMAFDYFARQKVDVAIVEVGLGGRLDSTNIISPDLSVITNISFDHVEFLGDTVEKIATEKAGIIKASTPVVIGETQAETEPVFKQRAQELGSPILFADQILHLPYSTRDMQGRQVFNIEKEDQVVYPNLLLDLKGFYQKKNLCTVLVALEKLQEMGYAITKNHIYAGLENASKITGLLGRWQLLGNNPLIVTDTGHNEEGIRNLVEQIEQTPYKKLHFVMGVVNDKNIDKILSLLPKQATYYFTRASIPRSLDEKLLKESAKEYNLEGNSYPTVAEAIKASKSAAQAEDLIFIGGSTFVVAEAV